MNATSGKNGPQPPTRRQRIGVSIQGIAGTDPASLVEMIVQAERAGVKQVWVTQGPASTDLLTMFAAAFVRTSSIRLGTSIVPVYPRHPLALAQQAATTAAFGADRLRLGVGTSHRSTIEHAYGLQMDAPLAYLREYVEVLRAALWDGNVEYQGRFFTARAKLSNPRPVPLLVATLGENAFRMAGEISDGAISWYAPARYLLDVAQPALREGAQSAGRPVPPLVAHVPVALSTDPAEVRTAAQKALAVYARLPFYTNMWAAAGYPLQADGTPSDKLMENIIVAGDEAAVAARLNSLLDSGLDELLVTGLPTGDPSDHWARLTQFVGALGGDM